MYKICSTFGWVYHINVRVNGKRPLVNEYGSTVIGMVNFADTVTRSADLGRICTGAIGIVVH